MSRALQLARKGLYSTHPNPRVGCVLVKAGGIVGEGWHVARGGAHAEVHALAQASTQDAIGADCYVSLEPCSHSGHTPPCAEALIRAQVDRVIAAMPDPNPQVAGRGLAMLREAGVTVEVGLLEAEAKKINLGFIKRMLEGMPYVRCKLAMSMDGKTALDSGASQWITGAAARADVQRLRAQSAAVMSGIGTVLADDPQLNVRAVEGHDKQPLRVIIDRQLCCPASARLLQAEGRTLLYADKHRPERRLLEKAGAEVVVLDADDNAFLSEVMQHLARYEEINEVLLESGSRLAGAMLSRGLIDEIVLYQAPVLLGDKAKGLFHLPAIESLADKISLDIIDRRVIDQDLRITARIINAA